LTSKSSSTGIWSYDKIGNETAGASTDDYIRTGETWSDHLQMTSITVNGKTYAGQYGDLDQSERIRLGDTYFHTTAPSACPRSRPPVWTWASTASPGAW
jgi:hypothetical protein